MRHAARSTPFFLLMILAEITDASQFVSDSLVTQLRRTSRYDPETWAAYEQSPPSFPAPAFCACDLLADNCEPKCCCDSDCGDRPAFGCSEPPSALAIDHSLLRKPSELNEHDCRSDPDRRPLHSLLCVVYDNSPFYGLYHTRPADATAAPSAENRPSVNDPTAMTAVVPASNASVSLRFPRAGFFDGARCSMQAMHLRNEQSTCVVADVQRCADNAMLSVDAFPRSGLFVESVPLLVTYQCAAFPDPVRSESAPFLTQMPLVSAETRSSAVSTPLGCRRLSSSPATLLDGAVCVNAVVGVEYRFVLRSKRLLNASVVITLSDVQMDAGAIEQRFSVERTDEADRKPPPIAGYRVGEAIPFFGVDESGNAVEVSHRVGLWRADADGYCRTARVEPILFGVNAQSACRVRLRQSELANCEAIRQLISTHVDALFSALVNFTSAVPGGERIARISRPDLDSSSDSPFGCTRLATHVEVHIIYETSPQRRYRIAALATRLSLTDLHLTSEYTLREGRIESLSLRLSSAVSFVQRPSIANDESVSLTPTAVRPRSDESDLNDGFCIHPYQVRICTHDMISYPLMLLRERWRADVRPTSDLYAYLFGSLAVALAGALLVRGVSTRI